MSFSFLFIFVFTVMEFADVCLSLHSCLGKNLAYAEMRIMLAKMVFNFDWELDEHSSGWLHGMKVHTLWQKPPLLVKLTAVT